MIIITLIAVRNMLVSHFLKEPAVRSPIQIYIDCLFLGSVNVVNANNIE